MAKRAGSAFSVAETEQIARLAETRGWQIATHDYMRTLDHHAYRLVIDEYLAHVRFLLPLKACSRVLHLRCGWGTLSFNLATCAGSVVAMDDRPALLRFVSARKRQNRCDKLHVVAGRPTSKLPFADGAFDAIILSDAWEAAGSANQMSGQRARRAFLEDLRRVLCPGGSLLIGGTNRLGIAPPPRIAAEHRETYWGYASALQKAGFANLEFYAPFPSHLEPFFIVPLGQPRLLYYFLDGMFAAPAYRSRLQADGLGSVYELARVAWRLGNGLRLIALARYVVPSYLILTHT